MRLILPGGHVDHGDALVAVAVAHERLVGALVERDLRHAPEVLEIRAVHLLLRRADLHQELAVVRELEDVRIADAVSADPHVVLVVDRDAVVRVGPHVSVARSAPRLHEIARGIELENRWRGPTAFTDGRIGVGADFGALVQRGVAAMDDEDVVLRIHANTDGGAEYPVVGERLGPHGVDLELRRLHGLRLRRCLEHRLSSTEGGDQRDGDSTDNECAPFHQRSPLHARAKQHGSCAALARGVLSPSD